MRRSALFDRQTRLLRVAPFAAALAVAVLLFPFGSAVQTGGELVVVLLLTIATLASAAMLPWERAASVACLAPVLFFLATVAVLRDVHGGVESGYSPLVLVPVVWAAIFSGAPFIAAAVVGGGLTIGLPPLLGDDVIYPNGDVRRAVVLTLIAGVLGWLVHWLVRAVDAEMAQRERAEHTLARLRASQIHDDIVQNLTAAQLALALEQLQAVENGVNRALESARSVVAELMREADPIQPGSLRRVEAEEAAAE
jgi:signal transduction histidine kinase